jgi:hypothetical protein
MRAALALVAATVTLGLAAAPARADGDPASDYLVGTSVFFPFDVKFPAKQQAQFAALVADANRQGYRIRVALITGSYDMGSVTALWRKPRTYARFLGQELSFLYKQRVLVVMPNGYGFSWLGHPSTAEYQVLAKLPPPGKATMLGGAQLAVQRLAAAAGVKVTAPAHVTATGQRNGHDRLLIVGAVVAALALAVLLRFALRRSAR